MPGLGNFAAFSRACSKTMFPPAKCGSGCNSRNIACRVSEIATACCAEDGDCTSGIPTKCGYECALKLPQAFEQCGSLLKASIGETNYSRMTEAIQA